MQSGVTYLIRIAAATSAGVGNLTECAATLNSESSAATSASALIAVGCVLAVLVVIILSVIVLVRARRIRGALMDKLETSTSGVGAYLECSLS